MAGLIPAEVQDRRVEVTMVGVEDLRLNLTIPLEKATVSGHFLRVGVPHVAVPVDDLDEVPGTGMGPGDPLPPPVSARGHQR